MIVMIRGANAGMFDTKAHAVVAFKQFAQPLVLKIVNPSFPVGYESAEVIGEAISPAGVGIAAGSILIQVDLPYANYVRYDSVFITGVVRFRPIAKAK